MGRSSSRLPEKLSTHLITRGRYGCVWLSDEAKREYETLCARSDELGLRESTTIKRYFRRFADLGPSGLDIPSQFKPQGRVKVGTGKRVQVFAMKATQWRVYGVHRNHRGAPAFVGLCVDPDKKKDKADPALLAKCGRMSSML